MKPILLIGRADCWKEDFEKAISIIPNQDFNVMSIGMDCDYKGEVDYFVTFHPQDIPTYINKRNSLKLNTNFKSISFKKTKETPFVDEVILLPVIQKIVLPLGKRESGTSGSSALLGVFAALHFGYTKIIICGCPLEGKNRGGYKPYEHFQKGWERRKKYVELSTRSMSGWTKTFLGEPTIEWLQQM